MPCSSTPPTLAEYLALDAAGKITRPLTDLPIGATTAAKRSTDAEASEAVTTHRPSTKEPR